MASTQEAAPAETTTDGEATRSLVAKLIEVRSKISHVEKNGRHGQGYDFATWGDVLQAVRGHLDDAGIYLHLSVADAQMLGQTTQLLIDFAWIDSATGETLTGTWCGQGWDKGDKGVYKAYSGALKYLMLDAFLVPTGDEPETGPQADDEPKEQPATRRRSAPARSGAPAIPKARAEAIVKAAKDAGMSEAIFKALLVDVGSPKVKDLDVDQAETVEARIAAEVAS